MFRKSDVRVLRLRKGTARANSVHSSFDQRLKTAHVQPAQ